MISFKYEFIKNYSIPSQHFLKFFNYFIMLEKELIFKNDFEAHSAKTLNS